MAAGQRHEPGGIRGLLDVLRDHGEAVEFDLLGLGVDLLDLYRGRLSWRRLSVLVRSLVRREGTELHRELAGEAAEWSLEQHLLATVADQLTGLTHLTALAHTDPKKRSRVPKPRFIDRPGAPPPPTRPGSFRFGGRHGSREIPRT